MFCFRRFVQTNAMRRPKTIIPATDAPTAMPTMALVVRPELSLLLLACAVAGEVLAGPAATAPEPGDAVCEAAAEGIVIIVDGDGVATTSIKGS